MNADRVAVITGATGGLGWWVSRHFASMGMRLALIGTNQERLEALVDELGLPHEKVVICMVDLTQPEGAKKAYKSVQEKFGRADVLLHLVGGWIGGKPVEEVTGEEINAMLGNHLWAPFHLIQAFVPEMRKNRWGRLIVISSPVVANPPPNRLPYTLSKSAQEAMMLTLAAELMHTGVTANILRVQKIDENHERDTAPAEDNASWTTLEEITAAIDYLCSEEGGAVNGARFPLYGSP